MRSHSPRAASLATIFYFFLLIFSSSAFSTDGFVPSPLPNFPNGVLRTQVFPGQTIDIIEMTFMSDGKVLGRFNGALQGTTMNLGNVEIPMAYRGKGIEQVLYDGIFQGPGAAATDARINLPWNRAPANQMERILGEGSKIVGPANDGIAETTMMKKNGFSVTSNTFDEEGMQIGRKSLAPNGRDMTFAVEEEAGLFRLPSTGGLAMAGLETIMFSASLGLQAMGLDASSSHLNGSYDPNLSVKLTPAPEIPSIAEAYAGHLVGIDVYSLWDLSIRTNYAKDWANAFFDAGKLKHTDVFEGMELRKLDSNLFFSSNWDKRKPMPLVWVRGERKTREELLNTRLFMKLGDYRNRDSDFYYNFKPQLNPMAFAANPKTHEVLGYYPWNSNIKLLKQKPKPDCK